MRRLLAQLMTVSKDTMVSHLALSARNNRVLVQVIGIGRQNLEPGTR